jgi:hypothetical protein
MKISSFLFLIILFSACGSSENYKEAFIVVKENQTYIKLKGQRVRMPHNVGNSTSSETYEDSILIQIPAYENGTIGGESIPVKRGNYGFKGQIVIDKPNIDIDLYVNDTDDKKIRPLSWNGRYKIPEK